MLNQKELFDELYDSKINVSRLYYTYKLLEIRSKNIADEWLAIQMDEFRKKVESK